ncbi:MAG: carbohydrate kinase family protein [Clostridia bacterium]|nr:carbohydrate kinase family protein [Clostridia bacterium]
MSRMLCVGDVAIEMILPMKHLPLAGTVMEEERYRFLPGGACGNAALAMKFFSLDVAVVSRVGKDGNAARLIRFFTDNGIDAETVYTEASLQTALTVVLEDETDGSIRKLLYRSAAEKISAQDIDRALKKAPDGVYLSPEVSAYIAAHTVASCEARDIQVFLDASEERLLRALSLKGARVKLLYTKDEALAKFTDMAVTDVGSALKATMTLAQRITADAFVVRMANHSLFLYDGKTYNILMLTDSPMPKPHAAFADIQSAVLAAQYLKSASLYQSVGISAIADRLAREGKGFRIPTPENVRAYAVKHSLPFIL